jgi:hypothetical protein
MHSDNETRATPAQAWPPWRKPKGGLVQGSNALTFMTHQSTPVTVTVQHQVTLFGV